MDITIDKNELYSLIKKAFREVLHEETLEFFLKSIPYASKGEMEDIETLYGKPPTEKEIACSETIEL
ncbi:MAG: hypothetical protein DDT42_01274 [candidate division WS2 bacterium]|uniref:Uncharacterized protein n=1 Tax=Psychracetigena formicireducens TaxID=2986056 RepID=A0A9E2BH07_PSYF1|nr:hypothetical protein [Candidatus Psychracetigena formicireducens]MBT9145403.1 hypothetical protein [Candidatus Psychracetigena formicireducens]